MTIGERLEQSQTRHKWRKRTGMLAATTAIVGAGFGVDAYFVLHDSQAVRSGDTYQTGTAGEQKVETRRVLSEEVVVLGLLVGTVASVALDVCTSLDQLGDKGERELGRLGQEVASLAK